MKTTLELLGDPKPEKVQPFDPSLWAFGQSERTISISRMEAKRLIKQGAVRINGKKETRLFIPAEEVPDGSIVEVGKSWRHQEFIIRWEV